VSTAFRWVRTGIVTGFCEHSNEPWVQLRNLVSSWATLLHVLDYLFHSYLSHLQLLRRASDTLSSYKLESLETPAAGKTRSENGPKNHSRIIIIIIRRRRYALLLVYEALYPQNPEIPRRSCWYNKTWSVSTWRGQHAIRSRDLRYTQVEAQIATVNVSSHHSLPW